jgi:3-dehydroquinate dehydratase-2
MRILVLNGPNLNMLGVREPQLYGNRTYADLVAFIKATARGLGQRVKIFQTNHEGTLVTKIQKSKKFDAIVINAGAFTHTSVAILDALKAVGQVCCEVHLTDINAREDFRRTSFVSLAACATFSGRGFESYKDALEFLYKRSEVKE